MEFWASEKTNIKFKIWYVNTSFVMKTTAKISNTLRVNKRLVLSIYYLFLWFQKFHRIMGDGIQIFIIYFILTQHWEYRERGGQTLMLYLSYIMHIYILLKWGLFCNALLLVANMIPNYIWNKYKPNAV